ncbi:hypothetical protein HNR46_003276 [Haloferula luteola]|uniref:Bacteriocin-protection, YdeI or OmpD-Associated n=1 Tax=Haloferula luteola TaxID=595692 RepID=A0A840V5V6_9BACT|nr:YdeI/OmpD-associated family protein [Haloferula luteola]MBB5353023.1 hypothetical protein [Haloferula luteola]
MSGLQFSFTSRVEPTGLGQNYLGMAIPEGIGEAWKAAGVRRLTGTVNGFPVNRGLQWSRECGPCLVFGRQLLAACGLVPGQAAELLLQPDPEPSRIDLPEAFQIVLEQDEEARARWDTFTPGFQRSLVHHVASAKREDTQIRRAVELAEKIRTHQLHSDRAKRNLGELRPSLNPPESH